MVGKKNRSFFTYLLWILMAIVLVPLCFFVIYLLPTAFKPPAGDLPDIYSNREVPTSPGLRKRLDDVLKKVGVEAAPDKASMVLQHLAMVREECQRMNLVAAGDRDYLIERHVLPSLEVLSTSTQP